MCIAENHLCSGMARVQLADLNGPKWTSSGQNGPKWTILVYFGLANVKNPVRNKAILAKMVVSTILDHFGPVHFSTALAPLPICDAMHFHCDLRSRCVEIHCDVDHDASITASAMPRCGELRAGGCSGDRILLDFHGPGI